MRTRPGSSATIVTLPLTRTRGKVVYVGFPRESAHSLAALHREIDKQIAVGRRVWRWVPRNLRVQFMDRMDAMGTAFIRPSEDHRIALAEELLRNYTLVSAGRVVIHELCHHYREERWPRFVTQENGHDKLFCRELRKADPVARRDHVSCVGFNDGQAPVRVPPSAWTANAGRLRIRVRGSDSTLAWVPKKRGAWIVQERPLRDDWLLDIVKSLRPSEWKRVRIEYGGYTRWPAKTLWDMIHGVDRRTVRKTLAYVRAKLPRGARP